MMEEDLVWKYKFHALREHFYKTFLIVVGIEGLISDCWAFSSRPTFPIHREG